MSSVPRQDKPDQPWDHPSDSATDHHQLDGRGTQDQHEEHRQGDDRDGTHDTSLVDSSPDHHHLIGGPRRSPTESSIGDLHRSATYTVDQWLATLEQTESAVLAVDKQDNRRFVRLEGDEKSIFTVWLLIGQHTLHHETFVMPAPIENHAEFYAHLLRRNHSLRGVAFTIGAEDAIYLEGRTPLEGLDAEVLDGVIGMHFEAVERYYRAAMRIGWRSLFRG